VRFFELRRQQEEIESRLSAIEEDLAAIENEKSDLREKIFEVLEEAGVERDRELDEAIELFALRQGQTPGDAWAGTLPELNPEWVAGLSARMEAIIRRFLPEARNVEIDGNLSPSLRFESKMPAVPYRELKQQVSPATIDLVCLALRLAVVETLSSSGERIPVILDDPLVRTDDARHDRALDFLVTDASERNQIVLLTAQEVKARWFLHQFPKHRERVTPIHDASSDSSSVSAASVRSAS
jgi:DNA repair exonuclease SbcCD ATPase subunit